MYAYKEKDILLGLTCSTNKQNEDIGQLNVVQIR